MAESDLSSEVNATTVLPAPSGTNASRDIDDVTIAWTNNDDSSDGDIRVDVSTDGGSTFSELVSGLATTATSYTETAAPKYTERIYRVVRSTDHDTATSGSTSAVYIPSDPSSEVTATTVLPAPSNLSASSSSGSIDLSWTNNDDSSDGGIDIERSSDGGSTYSNVASGLSPSTTSYTDSSITTGESYTYRVERNTDHTSVTSGTVTIQPNTLVASPAETTAVTTQTQRIQSLEKTTVDTASTTIAPSVSRSIQAGVDRPADFPTDPVIYYPFDGTIEPSTGPQLSGTVSATDGVADLSDGIYVDSTLSVTNVGGIGVANGGVTISMWKRDPYDEPTNSTEFRFYDANYNRNMNTHAPWGNGNIYWDVGNDGSNYGRISTSLASEYYDSDWHHFVFWFDPSADQAKIYIDGQQYHSGSVTQSINQIELIEFASKSSKADFDEFRVYDRPLSDAEITALYEDPRGARDNLLNETDTTSGSIKREHQPLTTQTETDTLTAVPGRVRDVQTTVADTDSATVSGTQYRSVTAATIDTDVQTTSPAVRRSVINTTHDTGATTTTPTRSRSPITTPVDVEQQTTASQRTRRPTTAFADTDKQTSAVDRHRSPTTAPTDTLTVNGVPARQRNTTLTTSDTGTTTSSSTRERSVTSTPVGTDTVTIQGPFVTARLGAQLSTSVTPGDSAQIASTQALDQADTHRTHTTTVTATGSGVDSASQTTSIAPRSLVAADGALATIISESVSVTQSDIDTTTSGTEVVDTVLPSAKPLSEYALQTVATSVATTNQYELREQGLADPTLSQRRPVTITARDLATAVGQPTTTLSPLSTDTSTSGSATTSQLTATGGAIPVVSALGRGITAPTNTATVGFQTTTTGQTTLTARTTGSTAYTTADTGIGSATITAQLPHTASSQETGTARTTGSLQEQHLLSARDLGRAVVNSTIASQPTVPAVLTQTQAVTTPSLNRGLTHRASTTTTAAATATTRRELQPAAPGTTRADGHSSAQFTHGVVAIDAGVGADAPSISPTSITDQLSTTTRTTPTPTLSRTLTHRASTTGSADEASQTARGLNARVQGAATGQLLTTLTAGTQFDDRDRGVANTAPAVRGTPIATLSPTRTFVAEQLDQSAPGVTSTAVGTAQAFSDGTVQRTPVTSEIQPHARALSQPSRVTQARVEPVAGNAPITADLQSLPVTPTLRLASNPLALLYTVPLTQHLQQSQLITSTGTATHRTIHVDTERSVVVKNGTQREIVVIDNES